MTVESGTGYSVGSPPSVSVDVEDDDLPPAPTGLRANGNIVSGEVSIWWQASTGATAYDLRYAVDVHRYSAGDAGRVHPRSVDRREWNHRDQHEAQRWHW